MVSFIGAVIVPLVAGEEVNAEAVQIRGRHYTFTTFPSVAFELCNADLDSGGWKQLAARRSQWRQPSLKTGRKPNRQRQQPWTLTLATLGDLTG